MQKICTHWTAAAWSVLLLSQFSPFLQNVSIWEHTALHRWKNIRNGQFYVLVLKSPSYGKLDFLAIVGFKNWHKHQKSLPKQKKSVIVKIWKDQFYVHYVHISKPFSDRETYFCLKLASEANSNSNLFSCFFLRKKKEIRNNQDIPPPWSPTSSRSLYTVHDTTQAHFQFSSSWIRELSVHGENFLLGPGPVHVRQPFLVWILEGPLNPASRKRPTFLDEVAEKNLSGGSGWSPFLQQIQQKIYKILTTK